MYNKITFSGKIKIVYTCFILVFNFLQPEDKV